MKGNLLIVEDDTMLLKMVKKNLEDSADVIYLASNGVEALDLLTSEKIHCVLCDINMPRMNGLDLLMHVRERMLSTPFIFFSGNGDKVLVERAMNHGAFDFIEKTEMKRLEGVVSSGLKAGLSVLISGPELKVHLTPEI